MTRWIDRPRRGVLCLCTIIGLAITCGPVPARGAEAIPWRTDLQRAATEAREQGRLLWVQFTGSWCPNCVRLERESFVHPAIIDHARNAFVPVKILSDEHEDLVERFELTGIPATLLITPSGEVVARNEGYVDSPTFRAFLERALAQTGRTPRPAPAELAHASAVVPAQPPRTTAELPLALAGYCPVSIVTRHRLVPGQASLGLVHGGQIYRFADSRMRAMFLERPHMYVPANGGRCPVTQVERGEARPGVPRWSVLFRDHLYLCADEQGRARFLMDPERYARVAVAERGTAGPPPAPTAWRSRPAETGPIEAHRVSSEALRR